MKCPRVHVDRVWGNWLKGKGMAACALGELYMVSHAFTNIASSVFGED